jgi:hypothetical protein
LSQVRPIDRDDLPTIASLYAELDGWRGGSTPGFISFFERTLLEQPHADPDIPSLVYEDPEDGVTAFIGSHVRRFAFGSRTLRLACFGPVIVRHAHRREGLATQLLRRFLEGPQDMTFNDRSIDQMHRIWTRLGATTDHVASTGWVRRLAPVGSAAFRVAGPRLVSGRVSAGPTLSRLDAARVRRLNPRPSSGASEALTSDALVELIPRLQAQFRLRPAYDPIYLGWLFETMKLVDLGGRVVRRLVLADDGEPVGAYVMLVRSHGQAHVMQVAVEADQAGLVLDHLIHDAAEAGAVEVCGRAEAYLLPHLAARRCRLMPVEWAAVQAADPALVGAVHAGRALVTRMDGEWWMRPFALGPPASTAGVVSPGESRLA